MEIAGMEEKNFDVRLEQNRLIISGSRLDIPEQRAFHQMEIHFGEFSTEIELPAPVNNDMVVAEYHQGFLRVTMPKSQPKNLTISS
jgi:HSP20 family protein